jgi:hypothetical protein
MRNCAIDLASSNMDQECIVEGSDDFQAFLCGQAIGEPQNLGSCRLCREVSMKGIVRFLTVASWLICVNALSQTNQEKPVETNALRHRQQSCPV